MANQYLMELNKKVQDLGTSQVVSLPAFVLTVFYIEGKDLLTKDAKKKSLFVEAVGKAFEPRGKAAIEAACKAIADANTKAERFWEASTKDGEELAKVVRAMQKAVADQTGDLQKKLLMACKISIEESRKAGEVTGTMESHALVAIAGKVAESSGAKGTMSAAMDSADERSERVDAVLKLVAQIETDLGHAVSAAQRANGPLSEAEDDAGRAVEQMKAFTKTKGGKEAVVLKASTLMLTKQLKTTGDHLTDANAHVWEAQRRIKVVEREVKPLKTPSLLGNIKTCEQSIDKAEEPLADWLKGKALVDAGLKPWDGKTVRDYAKLWQLLKDVQKADVAKLVKGAIEATGKLSDAVEAARKET